MEILKRSQRYNRYLPDLARLAGIFLILMTLLRYIFFFLSRQKFEFVYGSTIFQAFYVGVRFDLLVLGFLFLPIVTIWPLLILNEAKDRLVEKILRLYLSFVWLAIVASSYLSLPTYLAKDQHFRWKRDVFQMLPLDSVSALLVSLIFLTALAVGIKSISKVKRRPRFELGPRKSSLWVQLIVALLVPILIVGLAARGTLAAHHLEKADSEISPWENVNELTLNAVWAIDK